MILGSRPACSGFALVLLIVLFSRPCTATDDMLTSDGERLARTLGETLPIAVEQEARLGGDLITVYHQRIFDADMHAYTETENVVWWVRLGEAEELTRFVRDFPPGVKVDKVEAFLTPVPDVAAAALLAEELPLLPRSRITVQQGDGDGRAGNLVVTFPTAQPGDLIGISIRKKFDEQLYWDDWSLADDHPTARCELQVRNDSRLAFVVFGSRLPRDMEKQIIKEKNDQILDMKVWIDDIAPIFDEPYAPPAVLQTPHISLVWRAERIPWGRHGHVWYDFRDWNMIATQMAAMERKYLEKQEKVGALTRVLASQSAEDKVPSQLYTYVRDELQTVPSRVYCRNEVKTVDAVLEARAGAVYEKSYLLLAMLRQLEIPAEIVWVHDPSGGAFFREYPNWGQVDIPLVKAEWRGRNLWFDLGCDACRPGNLRARLVDAFALTYDPDADLLNVELMEQVALQANVMRGNPLGRYFDAVADVDWSLLQKIETGTGDSAALIMEEYELTRADDGAYRGEMNLTVSGPIALRDDLRSEPSAQAAAESWMGQRFAEADVAAGVVAPDIDQDVLKLIMQVDPGSVPAAMGDTWILPPSLVYGTPAVPEWPVPRQSVFYVERDVDCFWQIRIPLPVGWSDATTPEAQTFGYQCFSYQVSYTVEAGYLVVNRTLHLRAGTVYERESLDLLGQQAALMHEYDLGPVVLTRAD